MRLNSRMNLMRHSRGFNRESSLKESVSLYLSGLCRGLKLSNTPDYRALVCIYLFALLFSSVFFSTSFASADSGKEVYQRRCSWCHGASGEGDGPGAAYMNPAPRDLTSGIFKWKSTPYDEPMPTDQDLYNAIAGHKQDGNWRGFSNTAMDEWSDVLSEAEIRALAGYIKEIGGLDSPRLGAITLAGKNSMTEADRIRGRQLYKDRCAECHGDEGRGDGTKRLKDDWGGRTWPRDLTKPWTFRAGSGVDAIFTRITLGIAGTQMPSFADKASKKMLTESERWAVAGYVASLAEPDKRPVAGGVLKAARIDGQTPVTPNSPVWSKAQWAAFTLTPQIIEDDRLFTPTNDSINVKALYNDKEVFILLEWHDRTLSLPSDEKAQDLAIGPLYPDAAGVQFPSVLPEEGNATLPPFGMGGAEINNSVDILLWQSPSSDDKPQRVRLLKSRGPKDVSEIDVDKEGVVADGVYDKGVWRVVFKRTLALENGQTQLNNGRLIPFALAVWDGSNAEAGSRHTMTPWLWMSMTTPHDNSIYIWPVVIGLLAFGIIWLIFRATVRRG